MITAKTVLFVPGFEVVDATHEAAPRVPEVSTLKGKLRKAVTQATQWVVGSNPELARNRFLAESTDLVDLERRSVAWERAQQTSRDLARLSSNLP